MEITEVVQAQTMTSGQLKAVRDKVVVDKMVLKRAVRSLYPNFNINDPANMQQLETGLRNAYPEMDAALKSVNTRVRINRRSNELNSLRVVNSIPVDVMNIHVDYTKVPPGVAAFENFKARAKEIFDFQMETERLKRLNLVVDKRLV